MQALLSKAWWMLLVSGLAALAFGVLALAWPGVTLAFLVALFAAYAIVSGVASIVGALSNRQERGWWLVLLLGLVGVAAGVIAVIYPGMTALVLVLVIGVNAIISGVLEIAMAIRLRKEITGEWLLALGGAVSVVFGAILLFAPGPGALALVWLIAVYAIVLGVVFIVLALRVRSWGQGTPAAAGRRI